MEAEKSSQAKRRKKTGRRILIIISVLVAILIVFVFLLVPAFISSEKGRQIILSKINQSIDGRTDFADLSMGWFKGIRIADLSFDDTAGLFSLKVKQIATEPHYGALLTGNLTFGQTTIDQPRVRINLKEKPPTKITPAAAPKSAPKEAAGITLVTDITVNDGNVKVTDTDNKTVELAQINSNINLKPPGKQSSFDLNMIVAANDKQSKVQADGRITPAKTKEKSGWTLKASDADISVKVNDLDIESLGPFFALAGVDIEAKGNISVDVKSRLVNNQIENLTGIVRGRNLDITAPGLKGDCITSSVLDADIKSTGNEQMINIDNLNLKTDWAEISATGSLPTTLKSLDSFLSGEADYDLNGTFTCNIASLASQMPATIGLKEGTTISSGLIKGDIQTLGTAGKKQIQAQAELTDLKGMVEGKQIALSQPLRAQAQISPEKTGINIDKLQVTAPFANIDCSGNTESLKYSANANLAQLQSELGQFIDIGPYRMAGGLASQGTVSINEKQIAAAGSAAIENLQISSQEKGSASEPKADIKFALDIDRDNNILNVGSIEAVADFGRLNVEKAVIPLKKDSATALNATIQASNVDLAKLRPFAVMFLSLPKEIELAGIADSQISVKGEKQIYAITTDPTRIKNLKFAYPGKKPLDQNDVSLVLEAEVNTEEETFDIKKVELENQLIKIPQGRVSQKRIDGKTKLTGQFDCEYDWSAINTIAGPYMPEGLELQGKRKDTINFTSEYPTDQTDQLLSNLSAKAGLGFEKAGYMGLNFGPTDVNIVVQNGLLKIIPFSTIVNEGLFNFAAQADFKQQPALFTTDQPMQIIKDIKINDQTTGKLLKYLNPIFANSANVSGIANLNCEKLSIPLSEAAKNKAEIVGTVSISRLNLQTSDFLGQILSIVGGGVRGTIITIHPTRFVLRDGYLRYDNMQMDVGDNPVNFEGVIGLDKSLDMKVTLPYTTEGRTIRIGSTSARRVTLPITGTVDNPKLDVGKLLENQLKQELEEQLRRGIENILNK